MDIYEIVAAVKNVVQYKITVHDYLDILAVWFRDVLYFKATRDVDGIILKDQLKGDPQQWPAPVPTRGWR